MDQLRPKEAPRYLSGAMRSVNFRRFITGNIIALTGFWTQRVATGWVAWELTHSPAWLGIVALADLVPVIVIGPLAGAIADRRDRLGQVRLCQALSIGQAVLMLALLLAGLLNIWLLLVLAFAMGVIQSFDQPARLALVGSLVEREDLSTAIAISSVTFNLARFIAPVILGVSVALHSAALAFGCVALCFLVSVTLLARVRLLSDERPEPSGTGVFTDLVSGLRYTIGHQGLVIGLALVTAVNVGARPILELLPAYSTGFFAADAAGFAGLAAMIGAGATFGGLFMVAGGRRLSLVAVALVSSAGIALSALAFSISGLYWQGVLVLFVLGIFIATTGVAMQSLIQLSTDLTMRARVLSLYGLLFRAGPALGAIIVGAAAELFGLRAPTATAAMLIAAVTTWAFCRRGTLTRSMVDAVGSRLRR